LDARIKETELKIELVKSELKRNIAETKAELIIWGLGIGLLQITIILALLLIVGWITLKLGCYVNLGNSQ